LGNRETKKLLSHKLYIYKITKEIFKKLQIEIASVQLDSFD